MSGDAARLLSEVQPESVTMKRPVVFVFIALCAVSALSLDGEKQSNPKSATVSPAGQFDPTPTKPPTTTPTKPPTTTPTTTTTTTKAPTTTTTTTKAPTTTTTTTTTTTKAPTTTTTTKAPTTTTTTKAPTTTAKPTVPPPPKPTPSTNLTVGNYTLTKDKQICLMAQMALQIRLATSQANGTFIVQPSLTKADGECKETTANLTLVFKEGLITFLFNKSTADNMVYVDALSFTLNYPFSKGGNDQYTANNKSLHLFNAKVGHSYSCKSESLYMGSGLYLDVSKDRMQAFNLTKSNEFGSPDPCPADQPDYRVAIAVGVTLLVLIVIVVVAYLLGRRRRTDGYQTL
ncbi:macrosialin [Chelmon rostratus]|uniref:macrosialin n=1 Tax=Chelmon rostratus TaxID=109905 RepID=UPI001BE9CD0A|nr:macrosialin [Chelmon rostratus]